MKLKFSRQIIEKSSNIKFHENPPSGSRVVPCWCTDVQTDMTKLTVTFRNFANAPKNRVLVPLTGKTLLFIFWSSRFLTLTGGNTKDFELTGSKDSRHLTCSSFLRDYGYDQLLPFQIRVSELATYYTDLPVTFIFQCVLTKYKQSGTCVLFSAFTSRQISSPESNGASVLSSDIHVFAQLNSITSK